MFNIYYINYAKAYEIAMLLDNKILEQITKEHNAEGGITGVAETGTGGMTEIPLVGRYLPKLSLNGELTGSKSSKVIDTVKVITTKSTILDVIYKKAKEVSKLSDRTVGNLIKIRNVSLGLQFPESKDIVGLDEKEFKQLLGAIQDGLVGNEKFKRRFEEELRK